MKMTAISRKEYEELEFQSKAGPSWRMMSTEHEDALSNEHPTWDRRYAVLSKTRGGTVVVPVEVI